jgi:hypothetical protein
MRLYLISVVAVATLVSTACFVHRRTLRDGETVSPPSGLDSASLAKWVSERRAECPGQLRLIVDEGAVRSFDGTPARYVSPIVAVECRVEHR